MKLVHVTWQDAASTARWTTERKLALTECQTVGWMVAENGTRIVVAAERNEAGGWANMTAIPRGCIVRVKELTEK